MPKTDEDFRKGKGSRPRRIRAAQFLLRALRQISYQKHWSGRQASAAQLAKMKPTNAGALIKRLRLPAAALGALSEVPTRHGRACRGHPRLYSDDAVKAWITGQAR
jgi:hypothetical protein